MVVWSVDDDDDKWVSVGTPLLVEEPGLIRESSPASWQLYARNHNVPITTSSSKKREIGKKGRQRDSCSESVFFLLAQTKVLAMRVYGQVRFRKSSRRKLHLPPFFFQDVLGISWPLSSEPLVV